MSYINPEQVEFAIAHLGNLKARFNVFISSPKLYMKNRLLIFQHDSPPIIIPHGLLKL